MTASEQLTALTRKLDEARAGLVRLDAYYAGRQPLAYLAPEVAEQLRGRLTPVVLAWPRLVVNAVEERLDVDGFRLAPGRPADGELWRIWQANGLDEQSQLAHLEALVLGRSYVVVWAGADRRTPRISVESARQVYAERDPATRQVTGAVKRWVDGDGGHAVVYGPHEIVTWRRPVSGVGAPEQALVGLSGWTRADTVPNPLGVVPVVPLVNRPRLLGTDGESELTEVIPLADCVDKLCTDLMVSAEYHAAPRRWVTGMDIGNNPERGAAVAKRVTTLWEQAPASKLWIGSSPETHFGQFPEASLDNYVAAVRMFTQQVAAVTGLPPHYLGLGTDNPASADAIRSSEASLVAKTRRRQRAFGGAWEDVMRLALLVRDGAPTPAMEALETVWRDPETRTVAQAADAAVKLVTANVIPPGQAQEDLGYSPVQIERMREMTSAAPGVV